MMRSVSKKPAVLRSGYIILILSLAYFSQLHPYIHFHHSHVDNILPYEVSYHPIDVDPNLNCPHDGDDHHHHNTFDQNIDWYLIRSVRSLSRLVINGPQMAFELTRTIVDYDAKPIGFQRIDSKEIVPESITGNIYATRAPPALG